MPIFAYLDAGSGALLVQLIVGGAAGVAAFFRFRVKNLVRRSSSDDAHAQVVDPDPAVSAD